MRRWISAGWMLAVAVAMASPALAQKELARALADLTALKGKVGNADTRTRVAAMHRVRLIALSLSEPEVKLRAIELLLEPVGSSSDHIRMPAVYAVAEIANSTTDTTVKVRAVNAMAEPIKAAQAPIRNATIDALNTISLKGPIDGSVAAAIVAVLKPVINSGVNGVRMPAINALVQAVVGRMNPAASSTAVELLREPLNSSAAIGGMEVRMMAIAAVETIGIDVTDIQVKAKAMGLLETYADKDSWETEARARARDAANRVQATISK